MRLILLNSSRLCRFARDSELHSLLRNPDFCDRPAGMYFNSGLRGRGSGRRLPL